MHSILANTYIFKNETGRHTLTDTMGVLCRHCSGTNHGALQGLSNGIGSPIA